MPPDNLSQVIKALIQSPHDPDLVRRAEVAYETDRSRFLAEVVTHVPAWYGGEVRHVAAAYDGVHHVPAAYGTVTAETADCKDEPPRKRFTWHDCIDRRRVQPLLYWRPRTVADVVAIVAQARDAGARIKAVGAGHSFSDITDGSDYLVDTRCLAGTSPLDPATLKPPGAQRIFRAAAGISVRDLNARLLQAGLALQNAGGYTGQTIGGAISTGTHGSGNTLGPLADQVVSLDLVAGDGRVYRIEPADGISDPSQFPRSEDGVQVNLISDDSTFNAVIVGIGCMGIITSLCLAPREKYWLRENRKTYSWEEVRQQIQDGTELKRYRHWEVAINPYGPEGQNLCLVTAREEVPQPVNPSLGQKNRNILTELVAGAQGNGAVLLFLMNLFPKLIPGFLDTCLKALVDPEYVDLSSRVFDLGPINDVRAFGVEIGVPAENAVAAAETVFKLAKEAREAGGHYNTSPFSLRFVHQSRATLAPMNGRTTTCMIELIFLYGSTGAEELAKRYEVALRPLGGRPHWGLDLDTLQGRAAVQSLYGTAFDKWLVTYQRFNARGIFNNAFTERLGISV